MGFATFTAVVISWLDTALTHNHSRRHYFHEFTDDQTGIRIILTWREMFGYLQLPQTFI